MFCKQAVTFLSRRGVWWTTPFEISSGHFHSQRDLSTYCLSVRAHYSLLQVSNDYHPGRPVFSYQENSDRYCKQSGQSRLIAWIGIEIHLDYEMLLNRYPVRYLFVPQHGLSS